MRCRSQVENGTKFILIDFRLAQGLEASGGRILLRLSDFCHERGVRLLFTAMNHPLRNQLQRLEFPFNRVVEFDDLADGMKYVEDRLLG